MGKNYRLPGQTCPDIDTMIRTVEHLEGQELEKSDVKNMVSQLEDLRTSNSCLRGIAEEAIEERDELEQKVSELEGEVDLAADKIAQLEADLNCVKADKDQAGEKIKELEGLLQRDIPEGSFVQWREGRGQDEGYFVSDGRPADLRKYFPSMRHG